MSIRPNRALGWLVAVAFGFGLAQTFAPAQGITIPNTFTNDTIADAPQVNANFAALAAAALNRAAGVLTGPLNLNGQTLTGAATASGAWTFSSAGTALAVTNNATIGGTLGVTGVATFTGKPVLNAALQFPAVQVTDANANTLDDYEEGTWTPVLGGDGGTSGQTYTRQVGRYTKIGNLVHCSGDVTLSAKGTITGAVIINGLPFAAKDTTEDTDVGTLHIGFFGAMTTNWIMLGGHVGGGTSKAVAYGTQAAGTSAIALATADISNTTRWIFSVTYEAVN